MKIASWVGCGIGVFAFLFTTYTAVSGPSLRLDTKKMDQERIQKIARSAQQQAAPGGCCQKKNEAEAEQKGCSHGAGEKSGCAAGQASSCPHHK